MASRPESKPDQTGVRPELSKRDRCDATLAPRDGHCWAAVRGTTVQLTTGSNRVTRFYWTPRGVLSILGFVHADGAITGRSTLDVAAADPSMRELPVGEVDARAAGREGDRLPLRDLRAVRGDRALAGCARSKY